MESQLSCITSTVVLGHNRAREIKIHLSHYQILDIDCRLRHGDLIAKFLKLEVVKTQLEEAQAAFTCTELERLLDLRVTKS